MLITGLIAFVALGSAMQTRIDPASYAGSESCGGCHAAQSARQSATGHAWSLRPAAGHRLARHFQSEGTRDPDFFLKLDGEEPRIKVTQGAKSLEVPVEWAFGSGTQAVTFVSRLDDDSYLELHLSYYSRPGQLAPTPGHSGLQPKSLLEAAGLRYETFDPEPKIMRCFRCHSTGPLSLGPELEIRPAEMGVRCEACHGAGKPHVEAARKGEIVEARKLIANPGRNSAAALNDLCGGCHRKPAPVGSTTNWNDPWNTRHQPLYLGESACFQRGRLSCLTCHNPHEPLRRNEAAHYNRTCNECHAAPKHSSVQPARAKDCIACHMPRVEPHRHLQFTNHWIGIYAKGEPLRPKRR
jgi:hypothetical protein